ncbi:hypothetical protein, partial [Mesorhizobium sp. M7A.F.Ca.US.001.04.1.1]|uniref:hypothetical protein n=1 Tax=Mesorhizobium sp. M7A.F.Ca.US.001.04.1.1 TaxID=2496726 RepID=UPI0019D22CAB
RATGRLLQFPPISADVQQLPAASPLYGQHGSTAEQRISIFLALPANKWDDGFGQVDLKRTPPATVEQAGRRSGPIDHA